MFPGSVRYHIGDVVQLKKTHPCGSAEWEITRTGIDFGLRCVRCGRRVMIPRVKFERQVKKVVRYAVGQDSQATDDPVGPANPAGGAPVGA